MCQNLRFVFEFLNSAKYLAKFEVSNFKTLSLNFLKFHISQKLKLQLCGHPYCQALENVELIKIEKRQSPEAKHSFSQDPEKLYCCTIHTIFRAVPTGHTILKVSVVFN